MFLPSFRNRQTGPCPNCRLHVLKGTVTCPHCERALSNKEQEAVAAYAQQQFRKGITLSLFVVSAFVFAILLSQMLAE